jgi:glycosyltransferase involved in cell wall biosynthesis
MPIVVHVAYSGVGGTGSVVADLCPRLRQDHIDSCRVVFYGVAPLHGDYGRRLASGGIAYSVVGKRRGIDMHSLYAVSRAIRSTNTDVVFMHGGGTAWHWPLLRLMGVRGRMVLVEHGPESASLRVGGFVRHAISILCADGVIAVSERLADRLKSTFGAFLRAKPLWSIPNGIDTEIFTPVPSARSSDSLLMVGTLSPSKDHATLIRAFALLVQRHSLQLVLAGDGILRPQLEQLAEECGIREQVTFLGNVEREHLLRLYRQAAVFVFSTKGEGSPLALLEAMSCGLPAVASDVPGVREILAGGDCGVLVPPGQPAEMARAIERILGDTESAARIGAAARQCVAVNYSAERMTARYKEALSAL